MQIAFRFNLQKSIQAMAYLLDRLGPVDKVKLMKLLYIADRNNFVRHGYPITGSVQKAMEWGPVPSACLSVIDGEYRADPDAVFQVLHVDDSTVSVRAVPAFNLLDDAERSTLDFVIQSFGATPKWDLVKYTHTFPEYEEAYRGEGTSTPITYEAMLRHYKNEEGFRHNRPVIPESTLRHMAFPFTATSDADL
jgi:uncharacterized phage-associated protein